MRGRGAGDAVLTGGTGNFSATLKTVGNQKITATDKSNAAITGTSDAINVGAASTAATHFSVSAPVAATAGTALSFTVTAQDASNQTAAGYTGTVHFTSSDAAAVLPANTTLVNGSGSFSATLNTTGARTITATDTVNASINGTSGSIAVNAAGGSTPPMPTGVTPANGFVNGQTMFFSFSDPRGTQDFGILNVLINNFLDGRNACYIAWDRPNGVVYLVGDDGGTLINVPATGTASNSQCTIAIAVSSAAPVANSVIVGLFITFKPAFAGNKVIYMAARDISQNNSDWQALGVVQIPGGAPTTSTSVTGMTNARGSGTASTTYTFSFSDTKGFADLGVENILINNFINGNHACYLAYSRPLNVLYLVNDAGNALSTGQSLAAAGSVNNSQCTVTWGASAVAASGNNLSLTLNIQFTAGFAGNRVVYLAARDTAEANNTDWQAMGTWTVN